MVGEDFALPNITLDKVEKSYGAVRVLAGPKDLNGGETRTVPVTIVNSITEYDIDWGVIMATGMLLAIPPIIFTFIASKQIITGMTAGAVKG